MNIDGINRSQSPSLGDTQAQPVNKGGSVKAYSEIDIETLLGAKGGSTEGTGKANNPLPLPLPGQPKSEQISAHLSSFSDTQVSADIFSFMALFQTMAQQMRDTARAQRTTDMQTQVSALQNAAEKMKDAAAERLTAAIVQGSMQIAGGVMQAGMSAASVSSTVKGAKLDSQANAMSPKAAAMTGAKADAAKLTATGQAQMNFAQASGSVSAGLGGIIGASFTHKADLLDADKMSLETQAKVAETGVQHANDMMQQMMDVIRDVRDKLSSIQQASIETNRGIARNI